jgi:hypothetical protein
MIFECFKDAQVLDYFKKTKGWRTKWNNRKHSATENQKLKNNQVYCKIKNQNIPFLTGILTLIVLNYRFASSFVNENWNFMKHVPSQSSETLAETWRKKREYILNFKINIEWKWLKLVHF